MPLYVQEDSKKKKVNDPLGLTVRSSKSNVSVMNLLNFTFV